MDLRRLTINLPESLLIDVDQKLLDLRKAGTRCSFSSLVEVALRELLRGNHISAILKRNGATARRTAALNGKAHLDGKAHSDNSARK